MCWLVLLIALDAHAGEQVGRVLAGNLLELTDGSVVRLAGIRLPDGDASQEQDIAREAQVALAGLAEGRTVRLEPATLAIDRHGRQVAQAWRDDGLWLQGALLELGLVQVQTRPGEVALAAEMAAREDTARGARAGLWAEEGFAPRPVRRAGPAGSFRIVAGRVVRVAPTDYYVYLNFGADWRTDFTLRVARDGQRRFREAGIDLEQLAGREVEVRGFVLEAGGPLIELSHPEQLRIRP